MSLFEVIYIVLIGSDGKAPALPCNVGDPGSIPGSGRSPRERKWQPTPVFLPGKLYGQRSLVGYSPWDHKELTMTEDAHTHTCNNNNLITTKQIINFT